MASKLKHTAPDPLSTPYHEQLDLELLLMGVTGHGKSATGNSIIGWYQFASEGGWGSLTKTFHVGHTTTSDGRTIKVVDIPGFADTEERSEDDRNGLVITALSRALVKFPYGFHAVLLVVSYATRMTREVKDTLHDIFIQFDEQAFKSHGVLLVTNGDAFERDHRKDTTENEKMTIRSWLEGNFPDLLRMCGGRCVLFDNVTNDPDKTNEQVNRLLAEIDSMPDKRRYIPDTCKYEGRDRSHFESDRMRVAQNETISSCLGILKDDLYKAQNMPTMKALRRLRDNVDCFKQSLDSMGPSYPFKKLIYSFLKNFEADLKICTDVKALMRHEQTITDIQEEMSTDSRKGRWWETILQRITMFCRRVIKAFGKTVVNTILSFLVCGDDCA